MSNLVDRLRDHHPGLGHGTCMDCHGTVMDDAADEIERLRGALEEIIKADLSYYNNKTFDGASAKIARRALAETEHE